MIIVGDKKGSFRLVPMEEFQATTVAAKREGAGIAQSHARQERVEALVPVGEKLYISLDVNDRLPPGVAGGAVK